MSLKTSQNIVQTSFSAGGVVCCQEQVLLVCENGNFWGFPKGQIEAGETAVQAAKREIIEETGLRDFDLVRELGTYQRHPFTLENKLDTSELKTITLFLFQTNDTALYQPTETHTAGQWVAKDTVEALLTHPQDRAFYDQVKGLL
jgi:8-oxo-dGTP pyrophosphatase MutT (NUDIX family)